jgi:hypothetical protein
MYILLIFVVLDRKKFNAIWLFENIKQFINKTSGCMKYSDVNKKNRFYKTSKSFFKIINIDKRTKNKYFLL